MKKELLFKVIKENKKEYKIYTDGRTEGFGKGIIINNYFPTILGREIAKILTQNKSSLAAS